MLKTILKASGVARISKGGEGWGVHTVSHPGYLHSPLQMLGPENGVCKYVYLNDFLTKGGGGGGGGGWGRGVTGNQGPPSPGYAPAIDLNALDF